MVRVTSREGESGTLHSGHGFEQIFDDSGDGSVTLGGPDPRTKVDIVRDGYGDIAHGFLQGLLALFLYLPVCAHGD